MSLTWDRLAVGGVALRTLRHGAVAVGDNIYVYGGVLRGNPTDDLMVFNTGHMIIVILLRGPYLWLLGCTSLYVFSLLRFSVSHLDAGQNQRIASSGPVRHLLNVPPSIPHRTVSLDYIKMLRGRK